MKRNLSPLDYSSFYAAVAERDDYRCQACIAHPEDRDVCRERSGGIYDADHIIEQRVLKRELGDATFQQAVRDSRNGRLLGRWHHGMVGAAMRSMPVPLHARQFAEDYGLDWYLERTERAA